MKNTNKCFSISSSIEWISYYIKNYHYIYHFINIITINIKSITTIIWLLLVLNLIISSYVFHFAIFILNLYLKFLYSHKKIQLHKRLTCCGLFHWLKICQTRELLLNITRRFKWHYVFTQLIYYFHTFLRPRIMQSLVSCNIYIVLKHVNFMYFSKIFRGIYIRDPLFYVIYLITNSLYLVLKYFS